MKSSECKILALTTIAVKAKDFPACLQRTKNVIRDAQVMVVTLNPEKAEQLQPLVISYPMLAEGLFHSSGLVNKAQIANVTAIYKLLMPMKKPDSDEAVRSNLDLIEFIATKKLQRGDLCVLLAIGGEGDQLTETLTKLRGIVYVAPISLGLVTKARYPWFISRYLTVKN